MVDDYTRECLALEVDTSLPGIRVARTLNQIVQQRGRPNGIVLDNALNARSFFVLIAHGCELLRDGSNSAISAPERHGSAAVFH